MLLAEKELTIGWPVRFLLSSTKYHDRSWRKKCTTIFLTVTCTVANARTVSQWKAVLPSIPGKQHFSATLPNEVRYHVTYLATFSRKQHLMDCWRFFSRIVKQLLKYNFALENSWPWPLRALEGLSDVCTTGLSAVSCWEFGLDPSMA